MRYFEGLAILGRSHEKEVAAQFEKAAKIFAWGIVFLILFLSLFPGTIFPNQKIFAILAVIFLSFTFFWVWFLPLKIDLTSKNFIYTVVTLVLVDTLIYFTGGVASLAVVLLAVISFTAVIAMQPFQMMAIWALVAISVFIQPFLTFGGQNLATRLSLALVDLWGIFLVTGFSWVLVQELVAARRGEQETERGKVEDVAKLKDEFVFLISSELKGPIEEVKEAVKKLVGCGLAGETGEMADKTWQSSLRLDKIIDGFLDAQQIESGRIRLEIGSLKLRPLIEKLVDDFKFLAQLKKIDLSCTFDYQGEVVGDPVRVSEILANLLDNAIKYSNEGGKVVITAQKDDRFAEIAVKDFGKGISQSDQAHIFTKFFGVRTPYGRISGSGIGLYISQNLAKLMGGKITFTSKEGEGSTFSLFLPAGLE